MMRFPPIKDTRNPSVTKRGWEAAEDGERVASNETQGGIRMTSHWSGVLGAVGAVSAIVLGAVIAAPGADAAYMPGCYKAGPDNPGALKYPARKGPYRIALVNGYTGIPWREQS